MKKQESFTAPQHHIMLLLKETMEGLQMTCRAIS